MNTSVVRRRISPSIPLTFHFADEQGVQDIGVRLVFNMNAACAFEEVTGKSMINDLDEIFLNPSVSLVSALLWAALQENHPEYAGLAGLKTVRSYITFENLPEIFKVCLKAFITQLPKEQGEKLQKIMDGEKVEQNDPTKPGPNPS